MMWKNVANMLAKDLAKDGESLILLGEGGPSLTDAEITDQSPTTLITKGPPSSRDIRKYLWEVRNALADLKGQAGVWGARGEENGTFEVGICAVMPLTTSSNLEEVGPHG